MFKETWLSGSIYSGTGHGKTYQKIVENRVETDGLSTLYKIYGLGEDGLGFRYMLNPQRKSSTRGKMFTKIPVEKRKALEVGDLDVFKPIINYYDFSPDFGNIRHEGGIAFNSGKKPVKMLKQLINYHPRKDIIVLDFFAGSGSTGQAVQLLNEEDGGSRQYILSTNNENDICKQYCYPRLKNVIEGYANENGLGGSLKYYQTTFVGKHNILDADDKDKVELAQHAGEMLAIAENTLEQMDKTDYWQFFRNKDQVTAIYFREEQEMFDDFVAEVLKLKQLVIVYVFTWEDRAEIFNFENNKNIVLKAIPQPILEIYKHIYNII